MLIQKYYYQTNQIKYIQSECASIAAENIRKATLKTIGGEQKSRLKVRRGCLHQLNLEVARLIYATLFLK